MGMGSRATQPANENAADPGTANRRTYGLKTVRGDTGSLALSGHRRVRGSAPPVSRVAGTTLATADDGPRILSPPLRRGYLNLHVTWITSRPRSAIADPEGTSHGPRSSLA